MERRRGMRCRERTHPEESEQPVCRNEEELETLCQAMTQHLQRLQQDGFYALRWRWRGRWLRICMRKRGSKIRTGAQ